MDPVQRGGPRTPGPCFVLTRTVVAKVSSENNIFSFFLFFYFFFIINSMHSLKIPSFDFVISYLLCPWLKTI